MGFYIGITKIDEGEIWISYKFDIKIQDKKVFNEKGQPYFLMKPIYGYCDFNKQTGEFILNEEKTDPYFINNKPYVMRVWGKLLDIRESGEKYPIKTCYAS